MAIITIARQVAAHGDEIGQLLASKLNYKFIKRSDTEQRIIELGFPKSKLPKYDERKPGFFASLAKDKDAYLNLTQYAILEAASQNNVVIIGRGAFAILKGAPHNVSFRLIADEKTRISRLIKEFDWNEKQAKQRITESDLNREGFHKNFYNIDIESPDNFDLVLNTSAMTDSLCVDTISAYTKNKVTSIDEKNGFEYISKMLKVQEVINKLIFEHKCNIEFLRADIEDNTVVLFGVTDSVAMVEHALSIIRKELPQFTAKSSISVVHDFKIYQ